MACKAAKAAAFGALLSAASPTLTLALAPEPEPVLELESEDVNALAGDNITKVYVVFSNHLDVGYTLNNDGSCAGAVVNEYFHSHFPKAIKTGKEARAAGRYDMSWMYDVGWGGKTIKRN